MFDLTKEIKLTGKFSKLYKWLQAVIYVLALGIFCLVSFTILFPSFDFYFNFSTPEAKKNTIYEVVDENGKFIGQGKISSEKIGTFFVSQAGNFSKAEIIFDLNRKDSNFEEGAIRLKKGFSALFSPQGLPRSFNEGSLLFNDGDYYIISDKSLRRFENVSVIDAFGFNRNVFQEVSADDLRYNFMGEEIAADDIYPNGTLFQINQEFYSFNGGKLDKFLSEKAYLTRFSKEQAISKDDSIFKKYGLSKNMIGFANGTLVAYGESAFAIDGNYVLPIDSTETFESLGFDWDDVVPINGDEFFYYTKGDLLKIDGKHPSNTVFQSSENGQLYVYENERMHSLSCEKAAQSWSKRKPVIFSEKSLSDSVVCNLKKTGRIFPNYYCETDIKNLESVPGKDYQVEFSFSKDTNIDKINVTLSKDLNWKNLRFSIGEILRKIKLNYVKEN